MAKTADYNGSNLDLVEFDVSADKSSTESENEGFPLTHLPAPIKVPHPRCI